jgi:hypothetical protein
MLLPDNIKPENSIYYTGAQVLDILQKKGNQELSSLFRSVNSQLGMSYKVFMLSLDWLYLLNAVEIKSEEVRLCI